MTPDDVKRIRNEVTSDDPRLTGAEIVQGVRARVHAQLRAENPAPLQLPPPDPGQEHEAYVASYKAAVDKGASERELAEIHRSEKQHLADRTFEMVHSLTAEHHSLFSQWKMTPEGRAHPWVADAHHWLQFQHGRQLWIAADKLCQEAGVL